MRALRVLIGGILILLVAAAALFAVTAVSGAPGDTYTGCLKKGKLSKVAIGDAPTVPCKPDKEIEVSWTADAAPGPAGVANETCPSGSALRGFDNNGEIICEEP